VAVRFDMSRRSSLILVPMTVEARKQMSDGGAQKIQQYGQALTEDLSQQLQAQGYQIGETNWRGHHLFGIRLPEHLNRAELQQKLKNNHIHVSLRGTAVRISPNVYNTRDDMDKLLQILQRV